jgi:hypothetical protein
LPLIFFPPIFFKLLSHSPRRQSPQSEKTVSF